MKNGAPRKRVYPAVVLAVACTFALRSAHGEKVLIYDENKGIIFVDKDQPGATAAPIEQPRSDSTTHAGGSRREATGTIRRSKHDIHVNRKKDPPQLYFESGLQYYQNEDYQNALKNFRHAAEKMSGEAAYRLWMAKTYRQLGENDRMLSVLDKLVERFSDSEVADDALFEIAFYYQQSDHYDSALHVYARLAEQYPFGVSFASGEKFLDISRDQRRRMRAEMVSTLKLLGHQGETLEEAYESFQRANDLPVSGRGTQATIRAIKGMHQQRLEEDERRTTQEARDRQHRTWLLALSGIVLTSLLATIGARTRIGRAHRQLDALHAILEDLDTKAL